MWLLDRLETLSCSDGIAMIHRESKITFQELWSRSEAISCYISRHCIAKEPVIIYGNKDIDLLPIMIASLKTGRAYIPVDITFPEERLLQIVDATSCELIFDFSDRNPNCSRTDASKLPEIYKTYSGQSSVKSDWVKPEDNCYILFTSGSTGKPKGVQISRSNIENFTSWFQEDCKIPNDSQYVLNQVSYSFDVSVIAIYIYLAMGKTLFNIDKCMLENTRLLFDYLRISDISVWISTPAFLEICSFDDSFSASMLPHLNKFILAGEVLTKKLVSTIWKKFPNSCVINGYGPTEGTVLLSACEITEEMMADSKSLPIGRLLPEATGSVLNKDGIPVASGETGELVVISRSISRGYFKNDVQTHKAFFPDKSSRQGYHTGDLVFESNGLIYYIGRKDSQIKLNGFRIELDDISSNLNSLPLISSNVVLPVFREEHVAYIIAFVTLKKKTELSKLKIGIELKKQLKERIPSYMVPKRIVPLEKFPLNTNGKIDRKQLLEDYA